MSYFVRSRPSRLDALFFLLVALTVTGLLVSGTTPATAQGGPNEPPPVPDRTLPDLSGASVIPFSFGPPGARSLGMGGAFIALADDATAAEANPAGLTKLSRPEVSIHARQTDYSIEVVDLNAVTSLDALNRARRGSRLRPASTDGNAFAEDTRAIFDPSVSEVSFASWVKPYDGYTFSLSYQKAADFQGSNIFRAWDDEQLDFYQSRQVIDLSVENFSLSAAFKAGPKLAVGFSIRYSYLVMDSFQDLRIDYLADIERDFVRSGASLEEVQALGILDQQITRQTLDDTDGVITFNAGVLINPEGKVSLGVVYKQGADFQVDAVGGTFGCRGPVGSFDTFCPPENQERILGDPLQVPDVLGVGLAWRVTNQFKIALDANAISYSDLTVPINAGVDASPDTLRQFEPIDDEVELHFGMEYIAFVGGGRPLTVRAGAYTDSDHDGFRDIDSEETVYTFGLGTVLMDKFQIDLAAQQADSKESAILSMVYRF